MQFDAKKSSARQVVFDQEAFDAVDAYQKQIHAEDDDIMFKPCEGRDPTNNHGTWIRRFFARHGEDVQSHDFRATAVTNHYKATKDIVGT